MTCVCVCVKARTISKVVDSPTLESTPVPRALFPRPVTLQDVLASFKQRSVNIRADMTRFGVKAGFELSRSPGRRRHPSAEEGQAA